MQRQFFFVRFLLFNENRISRVLPIVKELKKELDYWRIEQASKREKVWRWPLSWELAARVVVILTEKGNERLTRGWTLGKLPYWRDSRWHVKVVILSWLMTLSDKHRVQRTLRASILLFNTPASYPVCASFNRWRWLIVFSRNGEHGKVCDNRICSRWRRLS